MSESAGTHLLMDGYVADSAVFEAGRLTALFQELVGVLDMTILKGPDFIEVPVDPEVLERVKLTGKFEDEGGITGTCIISTSHMSIHCWPLQRFFSLDVFSCKDFDAPKARDLIRNRLRVGPVETRIIQRVKPTLL